ncbi:MAG: class I SAM-dependent methyltransferase [Acidobacteriota bacterium]|nr:class I SAM-dependent methyltransferase [Acidobacteriota bacterium]
MPDSEFPDSTVDSSYYVAFGRRSQSDAEFLAAATGVINDLEAELRRLKTEERSNSRALEIGCGCGRLMRPMSRHFLEIHGVDVSAEFIQEARERLGDVANARPQQIRGTSLEDFADQSFDFVYSFDLFPHIPSQQLVVAFLREIHRVLRPGGLARLQFNGSSGSQSFDQWTGARFTQHELMEFAQAHDFQVLALDGVSTPSMWTTWRKQPAGWSAGLEEKAAQWGDTLPVTIHKITNASSFEPVAPCRGRFAAITIRSENLPPDAGLNHLRATIGSSLGAITSIGAPDRDGWQRIRVDLPEWEATGLLPVQLLWLDRPLSPPATLRVIPPGPPIPRVSTAPRRIENRIVRLTLEEIARPWEIEIRVGGHPVEDLEKTCSDPRPQRYQVNFRLPDRVGPGLHHVKINLGRRKLPPVPIEVVS